MTLQELIDELQSILDQGANPDTPVMEWGGNNFLTRMTKVIYTTYIDNKPVVLIE